LRIEPLLVALSGAVILGSSAHAEETIATWLQQETATGDWAGLRSQAEAAGLTVEGGYQTDLLANPIGGERQGSAYAGLMEVSLDFDLEKLVGFEGTSFFVTGYWASGDDLSDSDIGNLIAVAQAFNGCTVGLGQMYLEQKLLAGRLDVALGRLSAGDDFATSDLYGSYVSTGINSNPFAIAVNAPSFTADPVAQWGVRAIVQPTEQIGLALGVYNADPSVAEDGEHGVDFAIDPQNGVLAIAQVGYQWNSAADDTGLPGSITFGGYVDSSDYAFVDGSGRTRSGNYGFYLLLDQMIYREGGAGSDQGLTPWGALTLAPDQQINTVPFSVMAGFVYQGLLPSRDDDLTAVAVYYGKFSDELQDQSAETVVETSYRFQLSPWLYVAPDFQYVIRPDGRSDIDDAAVFGAEVGIGF
jgi:porin